VRSFQQLLNISYASPRFMSDLPTRTVGHYVRFPAFRKAWNRFSIMQIVVALHSVTYHRYLSTCLRMKHLRDSRSAKSFKMNRRAKKGLEISEDLKLYRYLPEPRPLRRENDAPRIYLRPPYDQIHALPQVLSHLKDRSTGHLRSLKDDFHP